jgi:hypothetical protein
VIRFYLSAVRRAGREGIARLPSETPLEFEAVLAPRLGDAEPDMRALTTAFMEARYSRREVEEDEIGQIRACWQRVRRALRRVGSVLRG